MTVLHNICIHLHVSISADASLPLVPKWTRMNLPCSKNISISLKWKTLFAWPYQQLPKYIIQGSTTVTHNITTICNVNSGENITQTLTHKARGVVVPHGLGVPKSFQQRVGLNDLILQGPQSESKHVILTPTCLREKQTDSTSCTACQMLPWTYLHFTGCLRFLVCRHHDRRKILNDAFGVDRFSTKTQKTDL